MCFQAKERTVQPTSQATPLAQDWLKMLQGILSGGQAGAGIGPLQREAGTSARQYLATGGGPEFQFDPLVSKLTDIFQRETERGAAQVREGMGTLGQRFGTPLAREEGRFRRETETDFLANLGEMFRQSFESRQQRYAQMIPTMFGMGTQALQPFQQAAGAGIFPTQTMFERPGWMQGLDMFTNLAAAINPFSGSPTTPEPTTAMPSVDWQPASWGTRA